MRQMTIRCTQARLEAYEGDWWDHVEQAAGPAMLHASLQVLHLACCHAPFCTYAAASNILRTLSTTVNPLRRRWLLMEAAGPAMLHDLW